MYILIILFPLLSCITSGFFSRLIGSKGSSYISLLYMGLNVILSLYIFFNLDGVSLNIKLFNWINSELLYVSWGFLFDPLTSIMLIVVNVVSFLVHMYSIGYMSEDPHLSRFMSYLSLFTFFMLILVTGDNFVQMFVGWEGVGLASYLLINFWYTRIQANKSAIKAILVNRIGDFGLVIGIGLIFYIFGSLEFNVIFAMSYYFKDFYLNFFGFDLKVLTLISLFLFIGAVGKSAQLGLHVWLPDAMEGPTPVSALIHAATMVTAGVFVLIRCSPLIEYSEIALSIIIVIGALTAFFASTVGLFQNDLKKVIAYSTCSQLGYMVFACGLSNYSVSLFHLMNHAFFKALLFLSAGVIIHALMDEQDMRRMGGLLKIMPFTYIMLLIGSLSLMGFPFLTGFYSKDIILELAFSKYSFYGNFAYWLGTVSAFCTAFYSFRLIYLTFYSKVKGYKKVYSFIHEVSFIMGFPLIILCFGSIFVGYFFKDLFIGFGQNFFGNSIFILYNNYIVLDSEFISYFIKLIPVFFSILGAFFSLIIYIYFKKALYNLKYNEFYKTYYTFFNKKWFFDLIYYYYIILPLLNFGYKISFKLIDRGFIELLGPLGITRVFNRLSIIYHRMQSGFLYHYFLIMVFSLNFIIFINILKFNLNFNIFILILLIFLLIFNNNKNIIKN